MAQIHSASTLMSRLINENKIHLDSIKEVETFTDTPAACKLAIAAHSIALEEFFDKYEEHIVKPLRDRLANLTDSEVPF